jgi:hypothetical protein
MSSKNNPASTSSDHSEQVPSATSDSTTSPNSTRTRSEEKPAKPQHSPYESKIYPGTSAAGRSSQQQFAASDLSQIPDRHHKIMDSPARRGDMTAKQAQAVSDDSSLYRPAAVSAIQDKAGRRSGNSSYIRQLDTESGPRGPPLPTRSDTSHLEPSVGSHPASFPVYGSRVMTLVPTADPYAQPQTPPRAPQEPGADSPMAAGIDFEAEYRKAGRKAFEHQQQFRRCLHCGVIYNSSDAKRHACANLPGSGRVG